MRHTPRRASSLRPRYARYFSPHRPLLWTGWLARGSSKRTTMLPCLDACAKYHIAFNVFRYITFRTAMALLTALLISLVLGPWVIRKLHQLQIGETIRVDGPERHRVKAGTPTMGGFLILGALFGSRLPGGDPG